MLARLELTNFRSYPDFKIELSPQVNLIVGPNASGKTNLLEALYVLATTKSFRAKDRELINHSQDFFRVVGVGQKNYAIGFKIQDGHQQKQLTHDEVKKNLSHHIGEIPVVLFEPADMQLVSGPPEGRRRYLDFILSQTDHVMVTTLNQYRRVLRQRNALLSRFDTAMIKDEIFAWDVKLTELAVTIHSHRRQLINYLTPLVTDVYSQIARQQVDIELDYLPSVKGHDYGDAFMNALVSNLTTDLAVGFTTIGPHREDLAIKFGGKDISTVASRGEVRTLVLALRLAELTYLENQTATKPILLLDDVFSELDSRRRHELVGRLTDYQTIITTTEADAIIPELTGEFKVTKMGTAHARKA